MSNDNGGRWLGNPVPIVMVALLTAGVLVKVVPLDSGRPTDPDRMKSALMGHQDVEARLWQDPLAAIEKEISTRSGAAKPSSSASASESHSSISLRNVITAELSKDHTVTVLAVSVFGGSFDAGAEWRRRVRFAILSALGSHEYSPENPDALGYYVTTLNNSGKELRDVQLTVPYEWFEKSMTSKVLVLWLDEDKLLSPYKNLISLFNELASERTHASPALNFKLVGPAGSGALVRFVGDTPLRKTGQKPSRKILNGRSTLDIFSPTATISNCDLYLSLGEAPEGSMQWNCFMTPAPLSLSHMSGLPIVRTTLTDDVLSAALLWELWQRGINRSRSWPVKEEAPQHKARSTADPLRACEDGIVLIHEWDTEYARSLSRSITEGVKELCEAGPGKEPSVRLFTYLRGIDGVLPGMDKPEIQIRSKTQQEKGDKPNDLRKQLEDASPEHAEGRNQFDYLRRLIFEIERLDRDENFAKNGVRAIGILGSDVYDKLLILMALQNNFQNTIFFTTDLDARYLHADQKEWTRNLVVASNFGLELDPKLQKSALPFRDTYQTAVYLAALMALEPIIGDEFVTDWAETMKRVLRPMTFEVGRTHAVHLASPSVEDLEKWVNGLNPEGILRTNGDYLPCSIENWKDCSEIQPQWPSHLALKQPGAIFIIIIFGIALVALASRYIQRTLRTAFDAHSPERYAVRITLAGIIVAFLLISLTLELLRRSINDSLKQGVGEPFVWLEGVSVWPSLTLRFISLILMVVLILAFTFRLKREANAISNDFGFKLPGSWVLARSRWLAVFTGPNVDLWAYDKDGKRTRNPIQRDGKKTEIATLWQNYLRATSWREKIGWVVLSTVIVFLFMKMLFILFALPAFPHRGELVQHLHVYLVRLNVIILWGVIFWTSYEARACARLIAALNKAPRFYVWSSLPANSIESQFTGRAEDLADYVNFRLVVRATQRIQWLIYLPFVSILFMVVAQSDLFDAMDFPPSLIAVVVLSLCYAVHSEMLLRTCAVNARTEALKEFEDQLFALEGQGDSPAPAGTSGATSGTAEVIAIVHDAQTVSTQPRISAEQIRLLMERIRNTREGALAPFSQQPALQALLLPFGGYGGVQLIEYMMSLTQSG